MYKKEWNPHYYSSKSTQVAIYSFSNTAKVASASDPTTTTLNTTRTHELQTIRELLNDMADPEPVSPISGPGSQSAPATRTPAPPGAASQPSTPVQANTIGKRKYSSEPGIGITCLGYSTISEDALSHTSAKEGQSSKLPSLVIYATKRTDTNVLFGVKGSAKEVEIEAPAMNDYATHANGLLFCKLWHEITAYAKDHSGGDSEEVIAEKIGGKGFWKIVETQKEKYQQLYDFVSQSTSDPIQKEDIEKKKKEMKAFHDALEAVSVKVGSERGNQRQSRKLSVPEDYSKEVLVWKDPGDQGKSKSAISSPDLLSRTEPTSIEEGNTWYVFLVPEKKRKLQAFDPKQFRGILRELREWDWGFFARALRMSGLEGVLKKLSESFDGKSVRRSHGSRRNSSATSSSTTPQSSRRGSVDQHGERSERRRDSKDGAGSEVGTGRRRKSSVTSSSTTPQASRHSSKNSSRQTSRQTSRNPSRQTSMDVHSNNAENPENTAVIKTGSRSLRRGDEEYKKGKKSTVDFKESSSARDLGQAEIIHSVYAVHDVAHASELNHAAALDQPRLLTLTKLGKGRKYKRTDYWSAQLPEAFASFEAVLKELINLSWTWNRIIFSHHTSSRFHYRSESSTLVRNSPPPRLKPLGVPISSVWISLASSMGVGTSKAASRYDPYKSFEELQAQAANEEELSLKDVDPCYDIDHANGLLVCKFYYEFMVLEKKGLIKVPPMETISQLAGPAGEGWSNTAPDIFRVYGDVLAARPEFEDIIKGGKILRFQNEVDPETLKRWFSLFYHALSYLDDKNGGPSSSADGERGSQEELDMEKYKDQFIELTGTLKETAVKAVPASGNTKKAAAKKHSSNKGGRLFFLFWPTDEEKPEVSDGEKDVAASNINSKFTSKTSLSVVEVTDQAQADARGLFDKLAPALTEHLSASSSNLGNSSHRHGKTKPSRRDSKGQKLSSGGSSPEISRPSSSRKGSKDSHKTNNEMSLRKGDPGYKEGPSPSLRNMFDTGGKSSRKGTGL
ncbi:hypothetical protein BJ508DRAFT_311977 [Ascobolus immersus RN42]|uniref:Uncharacterized protein n=1 Tax=Ascobolus immersus RN42 TaxID=1160509 RepID=A0A3N4HNS0_ASCIM|nr:hypothetical protein BJ508DRAFT_311977 [Ascobolus immersus RN42]